LPDEKGRGGVMEIEVIDPPEPEFVAASLNELILAHFLSIGIEHGVRVRVERFSTWDQNARYRVTVWAGKSHAFKFKESDLTDGKSMAQLIAEKLGDT